MKDTIETSAGRVLTHIEAEIAVRENELTQLRVTKQSLTELFGLAPAAVQTPGTAGEKTGGATAAGAGTGDRGKAPSADTVKVVAVMRTCPEPFTTASLTVATGLKVKLIGNLLARYAENGYLERVGRGEYKRTQTFPQQAPTD